MNTVYITFVSANFTLCLDWEDGILDQENVNLNDKFFIFSQKKKKKEDRFFIIFGLFSFAIQTVKKA